MLRNPRELMLAAGLAVLTATAAMADPLCVAPKGKETDWLKANEDAGGHAIACHVGKTEKNLLGRMTGQAVAGQTCLAGVGAASSFPDIASAAKAIAATVKGKDAEIRQWLQLARNPLPANLGLDGAGAGGANVGFVMQTEAKKGKGTCSAAKGYDCKKSKTFKVYLKRTAAPASGKDIECYVVTAFPD